MRQVGYHHLILPNGEREDMVVVTLDERGQYVSHRALKTNADGTFVEEPSVEWLGGTYRKS